MYLISLDDGSLRAMRTINQKVISYSFVACEWRAASARTANIHPSIHQTKRDLLWLLDKKTPHLVQINSFLNRSVQIICWELRIIFKSQSISQIFCKYPAAVTSEPPSEASDARVAAGMRQSVIFEARMQNVFANVLFTPPADAFLAVRLLNAALCLPASC